MTSSAQPIINARGIPFGALYNRGTFAFAHTLSANPLFELPALLELAARREPSPAYAYWSTGKVAGKTAGKREAKQAHHCRMRSRTSLAMIRWSC